MGAILMERINEQLYQANIDLVDRNKLLEEDLKKAQKRIDKAIEFIEPIEPDFATSELKEILEILKGEEYGDNW
jgi:hypothetical protein